MQNERTHKRLTDIRFFLDWSYMMAPTNWREDPGKFTRTVGGGGVSGLIYPLLDHRI